MKFAALGKARNSFALRNLTFCIVGLGITVGAPGAAWASPGCTALNGSYVSHAQTGSSSGTGFSAGDVITLTTNVIGGSDTIGLYDLTTNAILVASASTVVGTRTYTVPAKTSDNFIISGTQSNASSNFAWSCAAAAATTTGSTDSQKLTTVQTQGSNVEANQSGTAISSATNSAIDTQSNSNSSNNQAQLGSGVLVTKAPGRAQYLSGPWSVWGDLAGAGFDQSNAGAMHGNQINATAGIGYKVRPDVVVGVFGGYENFNYDFASLAGRLNGDGGTVGAYGGWAITPTLRWNTMLGWTGLSYDGSAGTAAGSFGGSRWLFSTGLTGNYRVGQFVLEPSAMIYALTEHQSAYADTLGTLHDSRDFSTGRVSLGGRAILPAQSNTPLGITPYVGLYGDYYLSSDNAVVAGFPFLGFSDGWSARVAGGLSMPVLNAGTLSLGADYGGIGADYKVWTGKANVSVPF